MAKNRISRIGLALGMAAALLICSGVATAQTVTQFPLPTTSIFPSAIVAGPDGALWFIEDGTVSVSGFIPAKIGRITTAGVITEYPFSTSVADNAQPGGLVAGPDGALWFTENSSGKIGRITTEGAITEYQPPTQFGFPNAIIAGPDGALWFTEQDGNQLGRITTAGVITEFSVAPSGAQPKGLTIGPDGAIWVADAAGQEINNAGVFALSRLAVSGAGGAMEFSYPNTTAKGPTGIVTGPDGALWFTAPGSNAIARFSVPAPATPSPLVSAVLPSSRSVEIGHTATVFATVINSGAAAASGCFIVPASIVPAAFTYQTTDPATNGLTGAPNTPVDIPAGKSQSFVIAFTPSAAFAPTDVTLGFDCAGIAAAPIDPGLNTVLLSASATPEPDIVALGATPSGNGILAITGTTGSAAFAVATVNVGAGASITATANTGSLTLPLVLSLCETNPSTGQCISAVGPSVTTSIAANATPTFAIFATSSGVIPFAPATNRITVQFTDPGGAVRGSTSVAVQTQ